jgi:hypothetical protein
MGLGVARPGTHPRIRVRAMNQINTFILEKNLLLFIG